MEDEEGLILLCSSAITSICVWLWVNKMCVYGAAALDVRPAIITLRILGDGEAVVLKGGLGESFGCRRC